MGTYSMFFFSSGSFFASVIGRVLDAGQADMALNPLSPFREARLYSNMFFVLAAIVVVAAVFFRLSGANGHSD